MSFLKILSIGLLSLDAYLGARFLLNVLQILQTSKYSKTATFIYAFLFLGLAIWGFYVLFVKENIKLGLWISIAPWGLILLFMFMSLIFGTYR